MNDGTTRRLRIVRATSADDADIRALLRETPMGSRVRLAFEREPSFFDAARVGGDVMAGVLRDGDRVVGLGTRTLMEAFVNGSPTPHGYLSDLRLRAEYRGGPWLYRGYKTLRDWHRDGATRLYHTVVFADNRTALATLAANRPGMPRYADMGEIRCPAILLGRRKPEPAGDIDIRPGDDASLPEIVACLNRNHARRQFAPTHRIADFPGLRRGLTPACFRVARRCGAVVGVAAVWDQSVFKRTRVVAMLGVPRALALATRPARRWFGTPELPVAGEALSFFHLSFVAVDDDDPGVFDALLRRVCNEHAGTRYAHFVVGMHERDPLLPALDAYPKIGFSARLFCVRFDDGDDAFAALDGRVLHVETGLL